MHSLCRDRSYSPKGFNRQTGDELECLFRMNGTQPVRFTIIRSYFGKKLIIRNPGRCNEIQLVANLLLYFLRYIHSQRNTLLVLRHIQESLIQRKRFNDIGIFMKDFMYLSGNGLIDIHSARYEN